MSKVGVVIAREFLSTVRRRSYLIITLGMPFFLGTYLALVGLLPAYFMARAGRSLKPVGVVDLAGVVHVGPATDRERQGAPRAKGLNALLDEVDAPVEFVALPSKDEALKRLRAGALQRVYLVPAGYLEKGSIEIYQMESSAFRLSKARIERAFVRLLRRSLSEGRMPEAVRERLDRPIDEPASASYLVRADGGVEPLEDAMRIARMAVPGVFAIVLVLSLMTSASYLLQGVVEEKESRVIEVILSSVAPKDLLFGKLIGLGAAGLLQLAVWVSAGSFATS
ncbi:MAG TPA: ABC transporter permease, partial [Candidatus Dormibacteraeota bacterium]|nr:ABC transporter permease [Candidatus Dormibacteraeota bacterium]